MAATCTGYVALTFDDGPASSTPTLLATLKAAGVRATLFNIGQNAQANPALVQAEHAAGMWIGNHSWTHPYLTQLSTEQIAAEISQTQQVIKDLTGTTPTLFRPPYLASNATLQAVEAQYGLIEINADVDSQDWNNASVDQIVQAARNLQAGGGMLMHDWPANTITAIPQIVADLATRGLCAGMISPTTGRAVAPDQGTPSPSTSAPSSSPASSRPPSSPPSSPPASSPSSPPASQTGGCSATYRLVGTWTGGFQADVSVANTGTAPLRGWSVSLTLASGQSVQSLWNGVVTTTGSTLLVKNAAYNATLPVGASTSFGFVASGNGSAAPSGISCSGV